MKIFDERNMKSLSGVDDDIGNFVINAPIDFCQWKKQHPDKDTAEIEDELAKLLWQWSKVEETIIDLFAQTQNIEARLAGDKKDGDDDG